MQNLSFSYYCVNQIGIPVELILNDVIKHFQQEKHQVMVGWGREQEPRGTKCFQQMKQLASSNHGH